MPYTIQIDHAKRRVRVVGSDPVSLPDALELLGRQIAEGAWPYATVHDARQVTWVPTDGDVRSIVAYVDTNARTLGPRGPVAFVAASAALFGVARMYAEIGTGSALRGEVFRDPAPAERWLDDEMTRP
jgi:hypothetical protein